MGVRKSNRCDRPDVPWLTKMRRSQACLGQYA